MLTSHRAGDDYKARFLAKHKNASWYEDQRRDTQWILLEPYERESGMN
ncbi:MAG TPA: hypothetical protein VK249_33605 [Anaerolineales bacterium]|nr:hypothetical protein [Anaerolineales bacterium]